MSVTKRPAEKAPADDLPAEDVHADDLQADDLPADDLQAEAAPRGAWRRTLQPTRPGGSCCSPRWAGC